MRIKLFLACIPILFLLNCNKKPIPREITGPRVLTVYPNPAVSIISLDVNLYEKDIELVVFNPLGKEILNDVATNVQQIRNYSINLEEEPIGNYFVILKYDGEEKKASFIKINND